MDVAPTEVKSPGSFGPVEGDPTPTAWFNVSTNFQLVSGSSESATVSFGTSVVHSQPLAIRVGFSISDIGANDFVPMFSPYQDWVIPANQSLSNFVNIHREEFGICADYYTIKMEVLEVRLGGQLVPAAEYNVLGFNSDGSNDLNMTGPGCPSNSYGQPGYVSGGKYLGKKPQTVAHTPIWPGCSTCD